MVAPHTDDEDVPEYLRSHMAQPKEHEWDTDSLHFMRWDWILDEMIWAFEQKVNDNVEDQFFDHSVCNGKALGIKIMLVQNLTKKTTTNGMNESKMVLDYLVVTLKTYGTSLQLSKCHLFILVN
jgi:hypothetical protein